MVLSSPLSGSQDKRLTSLVWSGIQLSWSSFVAWASFSSLKVKWGVPACPVVRTLLSLPRGQVVWALRSCKPKWPCFFVVCIIPQWCFRFWLVSKGQPLAVAWGLLILLTSLVMEMGSMLCGLSSCGSRAL